MKLSEARPIALNLVQRLAPYCERCEIAGSVRRCKPDVGDIEIVCIPRTIRFTELFGTAAGFRDKEWSLAVVKLGRVIKGDVFKGRYVQIAHPAGIHVDLFTATRDNWGLIYAIRTGSARFSHEVLARGWVRAGYRSEEGMLRDVHTKHHLPVYEESDLFNLIGVRWMPPENRS